jgi:hypothetical protein
MHVDLSQNVPRLLPPYLKHASRFALVHVALLPIKYSMLFGFFADMAMTRSPCCLNHIYIAVTLDLASDSRTRCRPGRKHPCM